tara:strand:+ start:408 stop:1334 length:927 start_codon:yes stop_codon:yes gene_type:complete
MKLNLLDLFSGIGGFHLGLERSGFQISSHFSEIDKNAIDVYKYNFKNSNYVGSVTDVQQKRLPKIDAITFGSPCQDFSVAGKRKGLQGSKSSLISEAIRLICECRPSFFIWENVKGTFSSNVGEDFWAIIQAFTNIGGYRLEWQLLNSNWFLPQNRERIYLVGYLRGKSRRQVFPIGESNTKINELQRQCTNTIAARRRDGQGSYVIESKLNAQVKAVIGDFRFDEGYRERFNGESPTLHLKCGEDIIVNKIRRLTPVECERLQGFPDNWTQKGVNGPISDSQRYKMCGNAVTVDVVKEVAKNILKIL